MKAFIFVKLRNLFQSPGIIEIMQEIPVPKISRLGGITNVLSTASAISVNVTGNCHNNVDDMELENSQHSDNNLEQLNPKTTEFNDSANMGQLTEFVTSITTTEASTPLGNMLQDVLGSNEFDNLTTPSESHGSVCLLQNRTKDPLLSSASFNCMTSGTTNSTPNVQTDQILPTTIVNTSVSSDLIISCQGSQVC